MDEKDIEIFLEKVDASLAEAQHNMLVEKALHDRNIVVVDEQGNIVHVPAKQLLQK